MATIVFGDPNSSVSLVGVITISAAVAGVIIAGFEVYKNHIAKAKIIVNPADIIGVATPLMGISPLNITLQIGNKGNKYAFINQIHCKLTTHDMKTKNYRWSEIFEYEPGGQSVRKICDPHPIAIPPKSGEVVNIQFVTIDNDPCFSWKPNDYFFELFFWINSKSTAKPKKLATIKFEISDKVSKDIKNGDLDKNKRKYFLVITSDWKPENLKI